MPLIFGYYPAISRECVLFAIVPAPPTDSILAGVHVRLGILEFGNALAAASQRYGGTRKTCFYGSFTLCALPNAFC